MAERCWVQYGFVAVTAFFYVIVSQSASEEASSDAVELSANLKFKELYQALRDQSVDRARELIKADAAYAHPAIFARACRGGDIHLVTLLLEHHVQSNIPDKQGWHPVHHAAAGGHAHILQLLKTQKVPILQSTAEFHDLPLHIAAYHGHMELVQYLLAVTPDYLHTKAINKDGVAHHIAASGNIELMQWYCNNKIDELDLKDRHGMLPVFIAALHGHKDMVAYLLTRKPRHLKAKDNDGFQMMAAAVQQNHVDVINYLRSRGLRLSKKARDHCTPAHLAAGNCYINLVRQAIELDRMKPLASDKRGWSMIHYATRGGCLETIKMLHDIFNVDLKLEVRDGGKVTIAHIAAERNHVHILSYLSEQGVDVYLGDKHGVTPMQYARRAGARDAWSWLGRNQPVKLRTL